MDEGHQSRRGWMTGKVALIIVGVLIGLFVVSVYFASSLRPESPAEGLICFTCRSFSGNQTFTVYVRVNVTDGMDEGEAVGVATKVVGEMLRTDIKAELGSLSAKATQNDEGIWTVDFDLVYYVTRTPGKDHAWEGAILRRSFTVSVNPFNQTAVYSG